MPVSLLCSWVSLVMCFSNASRSARNSVRTAWISARIALISARMPLLLVTMRPARAITSWLGLNMSGVHEIGSTPVLIYPVLGFIFRHARYGKGKAGRKAGDHPLTGQRLFYAYPLRCNRAATSHAGAKTMRSELREPHCGVLSTGYVRFRALGFCWPCASGSAAVGVVGSSSPRWFLHICGSRSASARICSAGRNTCWTRLILILARS